MVDELDRFDVLRWAHNAQRLAPDDGKVTLDAAALSTMLLRDLLERNSRENYVKELTLRLDVIKLAATDFKAAIDGAAGAPPPAAAIEALLNAVFGPSIAE